MSLEAGAQLGIYTIVGSARRRRDGRGVYRAIDTRLDREVALKILPDAMSSDPERGSPFPARSKTTGFAQPSAHCGHLWLLRRRPGSAVSGAGTRRGPHVGRAAPVRPAVGGRITADRTADRRGAGGGPTIKASSIATLKPANIKSTAEGQVKVLDFGLAKALVEEEPTADPADSPTITRHFTRPGVILGTAAYMSPEQARGRAVDKRTDIWAFGCVSLSVPDRGHHFCG